MLYPVSPVFVMEALLPLTRATMIEDLGYAV